MNWKKWVNNRTLLWSVVAVAALLALAAMSCGDATSWASAKEKRIAQVLSSIAGAGKVEVALFYAGEAAEQTNGPTGAVVVAQGADQLAVRLELIRAIRTLLGLPEAAVDVFVMGE